MLDKGHVGVKYLHEKLRVIRNREVPKNTLEKKPHVNTFRRSLLWIEPYIRKGIFILYGWPTYSTQEIIVIDNPIIGTEV